MERKFVAFHGTLKGNVSAILSKGFRIKKYSFVIAKLQDIPGDLGAGVYAYDESKDNAFAFAEKFGSDISVLELEITVDDKYYMDMDTIENTKMILDVYKGPHFTSLKKRYTNTKGSRSRECLDGLVLEHIINKLQLRVDLIRKETYTRFKEMPLTSHYNNGVELCIRRTEIINKIKEVE